MPLILGAQSAVDTGFSIDNSCRLNSSAGAQMYRAQGTTTGTGTKATFSGWFKKGIYMSTGGMIRLADAAATSMFAIYDNGADISYGVINSSGWVGRLVTDAKLRDPGAWTHVFCVWDTTLGAAADRMQMWINGIRITSFSTDTNPTLNLTIDCLDNSVVTRQQLFSYTYGGGSYYDGYASQICWMDGQAYAATDFGEFDEDSPSIWKPKDPSALTFGDEGFYLDYGDSADMGADVSGNSNDMTTVTAVDAADQATDSPTNNFSTLNPLEYMGGSSPTFSEGNCQYVQGGSSQYYPSSGTVGLTAGKWYWEVQTTDGAKNGALHGIAGDAAIGANMSSYSNQVLGYTAQQWAISAVASGYRNNNGYTAYGVGFYGNVIVGVYLDLDNNKLYFASGGTIMQSGTGIDITAAASTNARYYVPSSSYWGGTDTFQYNFGGCSAFAITSAQQDANGYGNFEYSPNDGGSSSFDGSAKDFLAICTKNLGSDGG